MRKGEGAAGKLAPGDAAAARGWSAMFATATATAGREAGGRRMF